MSHPAIILCHLGSEAPEYLRTCIDQIRQFSQIRVIVVADGYKCKDQRRVDVISPSEFDKDELVCAMKALPFKSYEPNPLWRTAALRFAYMSAAAHYFNIGEIIHFDNDVMLYCDPIELLPKLRRGKRFAITPCNDELLICGFFYMRDPFALDALVHELTKKMETVDDNEMRLLRLIADDTDAFDMLPVTPAMDGWHNFQGIFDCASWGQWVGGTHQNPGVPWAGEHHDAGRIILAGAADVQWEIDDQGRRIPICRYGANHLTPIFNLHIHSKELDKYVS